MEERYLLTAKQNLESNLQASSAQLKLLIIQNAALFQGQSLQYAMLAGRDCRVGYLTGLCTYNGSTDLSLKQIVLFGMSR